VCTGAVWELLCGGAATSGTTVITTEVDARHSTVYEGMVPHGHYCAPLRAAGRMVVCSACTPIPATFNAPLALSDHAWRAVEAGGRFLTLLTCFRRDRPDASFDVHVGIETGETLVGDLGPEQRYLNTVAGPGVHFASRLTKWPLENRVAVGAGTAQALAGRVTFTPWGPVAIGGSAGSRHAYLVGEDAGPALALPGGPAR